MLSPRKETLTVEPKSHHSVYFSFFFLNSQLGKKKYSSLHGEHPNLPVNSHPHKQRTACPPIHVQRHTERYVRACTPTQPSWGAQVQALKLKAIEAFPFVRPFVLSFLLIPPLLPTRFILSPRLFLSTLVLLSAALLSSLSRE